MKNGIRLNDMLWLGIWVCGGVNGQVSSAEPQHAEATFPKIKLKIGEAATLDVKAFWKPDHGSDAVNFSRDWPELRNFRPVAVHHYGAGDFRSLLPRDAVATGEAWKIDAERAIGFLRQFHPGARMKLSMNNGDSQGGGYATLARYNDRYAEIALRLHAEILFDTGWFTPGRFMGNLVVDRTTGEVAWFRLYVPLNRVNYDSGWLQGEREIEVEGKDGKKERRKSNYYANDGGRIEQMELVGGDASAIKDAKWTTSKTDAELEEILADQFYVFSKIRFVPFEDALALARKSGKPLHLIVVSGWLDDESC